jgi:CRISPR-associated protein Csx14
MAEASIPVDLLNPGQVFACLGVMEAAERLLGDAAGGFDWGNPADVRFHLRAAGEENPVAAVLAFLAAAEVRSLAPAGSDLSTAKWGVPTDCLRPDQPFPCPLPSSPATLPARLVAPGRPMLAFDHWGDAMSATGRDNVKFWAGSGGYPGAALLRDALDLVRQRLTTPEALAAPFALSAPQSSSFRFDWRRDYIPMDVGFSPNAHAAMVMLGYPLVEILAALGLSHARPERANKLQYRYAVPGGRALPPALLRTALGTTVPPFPQRFFTMHLGWPGQENQARCITEVREETRR